MILSWLLLLLLGMALPPGTTGTKNCLFCELTDSLSCPGIPMHCGNDEDCFTGQGTAPGLSSITNKGCMQSSSCGREEPVIYQGVTYSLVSNCCYGNLCNRAPVPAGSWPMGTPTSLALGVLLLRGL